MALSEKLPEKLLRPYDPKATEERIYKIWEDSGFLAPTGESKPFTIIMPPINANGSLHAGHGLVMTIEDIMIRYKRMRGYKTLWLPGLDHAGFETQVVYEKKLEKEGRTRFGMNKEILYKEILDFTLFNSKHIKSQIKQMGASCDWSREKFTLDDDVVKTVHQTFKRMYDDNLIYRGNKIISWCSKHQTSFSDLEIKDEERVESLYYLKYGPFTIATARPETKFGDKYVVMHPSDARYKEYKHGQKIKLEWINGPIAATVIKDESIDMEFGTGVMTITPWHDNADFEIAERHKLDKEQIIDEAGKLLPIAGEFAGQHIKRARPLIIEKLQKKGLVEKIENDYKHVVKTCYRCGTIIEPQIKSQWFVKMKPLAEKALKKIKKGEIKYIPEHYKKITIHWLENIMDWNISRQIVWGIPIPAWFHEPRCIPKSEREKDVEKCKEIIVSAEEPVCEFCDAKFIRDPDTFDTWFSSSQWPYITLQYPDNKDFKTFYPTDVMETAGDIIFFWVARMIMMGLYVTGGIPFKTVYIHGMILDPKGEKMSKSKGNVIDPIKYINDFGTDALRLGLVVGNTPGTSLALSPEKIRGYKNFANKLWNITRFVLENSPDGEKVKGELKDEFDKLRDDITSDMENFRFYLAAEKIYHYVWHRFADEIIEESKKNAEVKSSLKYIWENCLKLLHPFMPFVTEEIWQIMHPGKLLMVETWPHDN